MKPSISLALPSSAGKKPILRCLRMDENDSSPLDGKMALRSYKKKQALLYEGHPALGVFFLQSGRIKIYKMGCNGRPHILFIARRGDFLGIESVLRGEDFSSSAEMLEDGVVGFMSREKFTELLLNNTRFSLELTQALAKRISLSDEERVSLAEGSVRERMARTLVLLTRAFGHSVKGGILIDLKLSREDLASLVGTAMGTALRLLKEFKEDNAIHLEKKHIVVQNSEYLEKSPI
jgi:CRP/FNR family transcriptional regulator